MMGKEEGKKMEEGINKNRKLKNKKKREEGRDQVKIGKQRREVH